MFINPKRDMKICQLHDWYCCCDRSFPLLFVLSAGSPLPFLVERSIKSGFGVAIVV